MLQHSSPTPLQHHRALDIPEVVEAILRYVVAKPLLSISDVIQVDNDDRKTAKHLQALLVCRLWYAIGYQLLAHDLEWCNIKTVDAAWMEELVRCRRLVCRFETTTYTDNGSNKAILEENWGALSRRLREILPDSPCHELRQRPTLYRRCGQFANELCIRGHFKFYSHLVPLLSIPKLYQSITMLDLHFNNFDMIDPTLFFCTTHTDMATAPIQPLPNLRHLYLHKVFIAGVDFYWNLVEPSNLCSLSLENVRVRRIHLHNLLVNLCGPKLMHLRLKSIFIPHTTPIVFHSSAMGGVPFRTVSNVAVKCPQLESLEVDRSTTVRMMGGVWALSDAFPQARVLRIDNWSFYYSWVTQPNTTSYPSSSPCSALSPASSSPSVMPSLPPDTAANASETTKERVLTRIDIQGPDRILSTKSAVEEFRTFMHDPISCQHLLELTALHVDIHVDLLTQHIPWQCRHLQVLHLGFSDPTQTSTTPSSAAANTTSKATSRRIFGFITTTFPNLRHLILRGPICISEAAGGFCFLSRLQSLETLTLRASTISLWSNVRLKIPPMMASGMEEPRWMLSDVKVIEKVRRLSSLRQCRAVARLDPFEGFFGSVDGKELLWPGNSSNDNSSTLKEEEESMKEANTSRESQSRPVKPFAVEGCRWERMQTIRFELTDFYPLHQAPVATSLEMMKGLRPDVCFLACHVYPGTVDSR